MRGWSRGTFLQCPKFHQSLQEELACAGLASWPIFVLPRLCHQVFDYLATAQPVSPARQGYAAAPLTDVYCAACTALQGTTTNGKCLLPFKTGAFLAGAPVRPVVLEYGPDRVSAAWESIDAVWHAFLMLANVTHSVTAYEVSPSRVLVFFLAGAERECAPQRDKCAWAKDYHTCGVACGPHAGQRHAL